MTTKTLVNKHRCNYTFEHAEERTLRRVLLEDWSDAEWIAMIPLDGEDDVYLMRGGPASASRCGVLLFWGAVEPQLIREAKFDSWLSDRNLDWDKLETEHFS